MMITKKGKYNTANIMIDSIDDATDKQIQDFLNHPAFANSYIAIMPDTHAGKGAVIGFTMKMNDYLIPNVIGVDIGCGMLSAKFDLSNIDLKKFDLFIKENIPSGFHIHTDNRHFNQTLSRDLVDIYDVCHKIGIDENKVIKSIGTLGGGNHFIEAGIDSKGFIWVTIHSGSRNFGLRVANYHQNKAKEILKQYFSPYVGTGLEFLVVGTPEYNDYLSDLKIAQQYAALNRWYILREIINFFGNEPIKQISSVHNFIDEDNIIRKGATPAHEGEDVIIPFNMRDGIAICKGKGNPKYNYSAPHGAGRILSRVKAKEQLSVENFKKQMSDAGVYTSTATAETLDEAPDAYKDMNVILENIKETVDVVEMVKPIYNFKAGSD